MKARIRGWIADKITDIVVNFVVIGGHCGCCGDVIKNELFPRNWPFGLCKKCREGSDD